MNACTTMSSSNKHQAVSTHQQTAVGLGVVSSTCIALLLHTVFEGLIDHTTQTTKLEALARNASIHDSHNVQELYSRNGKTLLFTHL